MDTSLDDLIQRCKRIDERAWDEIERRYRLKWYSIVKKILYRTGWEENANDAYQDGCIKVYIGIVSCDFQVGTDFEAWSATVFRNVAIDHYRRKQRSPIVETDINPEKIENSESEDWLIERLLQEAFAEQVAKLDPEAMMLIKERKRIIQQAINKMSIR